MSSLRRHGIPGSRAARTATPQNLSAAVQGMRWQGTNTKDGQLRITPACPSRDAAPDNVSRAHYGLRSDIEPSRRAHPLECPIVSSGQWLTSAVRFSAACVATKVPRIFISITRSSSSSVASSNILGMAVPALFMNTSRRPRVLTVFSTPALLASASAASA
jgi:hypothetical protein